MLSDIRKYLPGHIESAGRGNVKFVPKTSTGVGIPGPHPTELRLATFNVGGVDALRKGPDRITTVRDALTRDLQRMSEDCDPDVIALQEVVRVTDAHTTLDIVCLPEGYDYKFVEAFNSHDYQAPGRKQKYRDAGWKPEVRLQQGMAFAVKRQ